MTALEFATDYARDSDYRVFVWECDEDNIKVLRKNLRNVRYTLEPYAMWSGKETLHFMSGRSTSSCVSDDGGIEVQAESIDNVHAGQVVTFLKMDIEGSEIEALKGAEKIIREQKPKLAISIYHKPEHLFQIPLLIHEMVPEYRLYIRHHTETFADTVLYAIYQP